MKQFALAITLIAIPVGVFSTYQSLAARSVATAAASLGDLSEFKTVAEDVRRISAGGDFVAAEKRATDFESLWDVKAHSLRPLDPEAWGNIDAAADALFKALRQGKPTADTVDPAAAELQAALDTAGKGPAAGTGIGTGTGSSTGAAQALVDGIAVTDAKGHPIPCEDLVGKLKGLVAGGTLPEPRNSQARDYLAKALERCNADDDARADAFSAKGIALAGK